VRNPFAASVVAAVAMLGMLSLISIPAAAQSEDAQPKSVKPMPRLADGHPDLGNGKGVWSVQIAQDMTAAARYKMLDGPVDVPFLPAAKKIFDQRVATFSKDDPEATCLPPGIPRIMNSPGPMQIYQLPDRIMEVFEGSAHMWRPIYMDGRKHTDPDKWNPTYLGEAIGHWEGDTLVVDVTGFNDRTWLDAAGHPHGEKLHVVERYTREDYDTLHYRATIEDPDYYSKSWNVGWKIRWVDGWEPYEYICQENNRDVSHMVGTPSSDKRP
jgi:hypothetical protein